MFQSSILNRLQVIDNLRDFVVAQLRLRKGRHVTNRMSDQIERLLIAPVERNEARPPRASSLRAMASTAVGLVHTLARILCRPSSRPDAHGHHQNDTRENEGPHTH